MGVPYYQAEIIPFEPDTGNAVVGNLTMIFLIAILFT